MAKVKDGKIQLRLVKRSADAKSLMKWIEQHGCFEYLQWGDVIKLSYLSAEEMPFKIFIDGVRQEDKRYQDILKFIFQNRKSINIKVKQMQGYSVRPLYQEARMSKKRLNKIYTSAYLNYFLNPARENYFYLQGIEDLTKELLPISEYESLKQEAYQKFIKIKDERTKELRNVP